MELEVLAVSWPELVLKREAEKCRLLVPFVPVRGLVPEWHERHWMLGSVYQGFCRLTRQGYQREETGVYTAKFPYKLHLDTEFDILDEFTGSPFTGAQLQMLTSRHLSSKYRHFRDQSSDTKLPKSPWQDVHTQVFFLHDARQAESLRKKWSLFNPPLTAIRNYLGEKMAFCLAWRMCWIKWGLLLPALTGLISLLYGVILLADRPDNPLPFIRSDEPDLDPDLNPDSLSSKLDVTAVLKSLVDNHLVPYHALFACLWTVVHLLKWFSDTTFLQFQWGVVGYTLQAERERPGYSGTPLDETFENRNMAPGAREKFYVMLKRMVSKIAIIASLGLVILSFFLSLYVKFHLRQRLERQEGYGVVDANFIANIVSSTVNAICISILSKIFVVVAYRLSVYENHIFETDFKRSLTWKLFILEFFNTHFKTLLILFFRDIFEKDGIFGFPPDICRLCAESDCLTAIALNVLMILIVQDFLLPVLLWGVSIIRHYDYLKVQEMGVTSHGKTMESKLNVAHIVAQIEEELALPSETIPGAVDEDYTAILFMLRKMKLYSLVVMYSAACPLAPALLLCLEMVGHYVDRDKFTGRSRRVAAQSADNLKYWTSMQELVNTIGIITNAFIISHVSGEGRKLFGIDWGNFYNINLSNLCDPCDELAQVKGIGLWVLCVSIVVILVVTAQIISLFFSFTSVQLKVAMRREKYETSKKLSQLSRDTPLSGDSKVPTNCTQNTPVVGDITPRSVRKVRSDNVTTRSPGSVRSFGSADSRGTRTFEYATHKTTPM